MIALGYITAVFTLVLIVITAIYATANWRTVRLMEADLRFRTQPIPTVQLNVVKVYDHLQLEVTIETASAPLRIEMVHVHFRSEKGTTLTSLFLSLRGKYLPVGETVRVRDTFKPNQGALTDSHVILTYSDLAGLFRYQSTFMPDASITTNAYPMNTASIFKGWRTRIE